jgi:hypothetical protein
MEKGEKFSGFSMHSYTVLNFIISFEGRGNKSHFYVDMGG